MLYHPTRTVPGAATFGSVTEDEAVQETWLRYELSRRPASGWRFVEGRVQTIRVVIDPTGSGTWARWRDGREVLREARQAGRDQG